MIAPMTESHIPAAPAPESVPAQTFIGESKLPKWVEATSPSAAVIRPGLPTDAPHAGAWGVIIRQLAPDSVLIHTCNGDEITERLEDLMVPPAGSDVDRLVSDPANKASQDVHKNPAIIGGDAANPQVSQRPAVPTLPPLQEAFTRALDGIALAIESLEHASRLAKDATFDSDPISEKHTELLNIYKAVACTLVDAHMSGDHPAMNLEFQKNIADLRPVAGTPLSTAGGKALDARRFLAIATELEAMIEAAITEEEGRDWLLIRATPNDAPITVYPGLNGGLDDIKDAADTLVDQAADVLGRAFCAIERRRVCEGEDE